MASEGHSQVHRSDLAARYGRYGHEINHIRDIEIAIDAYTAELEKTSFPTRAACEAARIEASQAFTPRVKAFAEASNLERDGYQKQ